jgi:hypothetical protein
VRAVDRLPGRAPIVDVGPALRDTLARARGARLTTKDWRALAAIIDRTASWSRLEDRVTHHVLRELSGLDRSDLRKSLRRLAAKGVVGYEPGAGWRFSRIALAPSVLEEREATPPPSEEGEPAPLSGNMFELARERTAPPSSRAAAPPSEEGDTAPLNEKDQRLGPSERTPWATDVAHEQPRREQSLADGRARATIEGAGT